MYNTLASVATLWQQKNLIVHTLRIIQMYEIPRAKPPIQICLGYLFRERVGIIPSDLKVPETSVFSGAFCK